MNPEKLSELVNQSGFPLQIRIKTLVDRTTGDHGWRVMYTEHSWKNPEDQTSGFLDLVLEDRRERSVLAIECKRVLDSDWVFLQPGDHLILRRHVKAWLVSRVGGSFKAFDWDDVALDPRSPQCEYCVVSGQDPKSRPMLERVASDLVSATAALAYEERDFLPRDALRMYFSVVVTTARLKVCVLDPEKINLSDGKLPEAKFEEVPYVRFRKQLSTRFTVNILTTGRRAQQRLLSAKEHTVFVVNSEALVGFLSEFAVDDGSIHVP